MFIQIQAFEFGAKKYQFYGSLKAEIVIAFHFLSVLVYVITDKAPSKSKKIQNQKKCFIFYFKHMTNIATEQYWAKSIFLKCDKPNILLFTNETNGFLCNSN